MFSDECTDWARQKKSLMQALCDVKFIRTLVCDEFEIDALIDELRESAEEMATVPEDKDEFSSKKEDHSQSLGVLKVCPMEPALRRIMAEFYAETGEYDVPEFYDRILRRYYERFPEEAAALHPLCILCQSMRDIRGFESGFLTTQILCRSTLTGDVAYSKLGLRIAKLTPEQASEKLSGHACLYHQREI
ncbi:MAG: hypothetical protein NUW37_09690 [Planctomycetes bacterium]|nr:hypothetical protein [Planctomycetota bacterium]